MIENVQNHKSNLVEISRNCQNDHNWPEMTKSGRRGQNRLKGSQVGKMAENIEKTENIKNGRK